MKKHEQIVYLASSGIVKTSVIFCCHKCETEFPVWTPYVYRAACEAVAAGWCVRNLGDIFCPKCAGE